MTTSRVSGVFGGLGRWVVRRRRWVIGVWGVLAAAGVLIMPSVSEFSMSTGFLAHGVESVDARHLVNEKFPAEEGTASTALVVIENPAGLSAADEVYAREVAQGVRGWAPGQVASVTSMFDQPELRANLVSADGTAMLVPVGLRSEGFASETGDAVEAIRGGLPAPPAGTEVFVSGDAGLGGDHIQACLDALATTALVTIGLIAAILLFVYRSPVAALVPLAGIGVSAAVSLGLLGVLMDAGVEFSSFLQQFLILIVFGAGTDYCLFLLSRYREELARGRSREDAVAETMSRVGVVIASSAAVVAAGFLVMALARFEMLATIGPGLALGVAVTLAAGLTLVPALAASVRPAVLFWPRPPRAGRDELSHGAWRWLARQVARRPALVGGLGLAALVAPLVYLPSLELTFEVDRDLPASYESVAGYEVMAAKFDPAETMPTTVVAQRAGGWSGPEGLAALTGLGDRLAATPGVAFVRSATRPQGDPVPPQVALAVPESLAYYVSGDGTTTRLLVGPAARPYSNDAYDTVRDVRDEAGAWAGANGATVLVGGPSADSVDLIDAIGADTPRIVGLVVASTVVVIALLLGSLVAPLFLLASVLLTVATTLAVTGLVYQELFDFRYAGVDWVAPLLLFVLLVVLASDYSIFLMSRIKEETERAGDMAAGVERGVAHTGGVISACGLILAGTFAALILTPLGSLIQMGFAITFGVLFDTFVVRPLVIPAIARLLGRATWWPGRLSRRPAGPDPSPVPSPERPPARAGVPHTGH